MFDLSAFAEVVSVINRVILLEVRQELGDGLLECMQSLVLNLIIPSHVRHVLSIPWPVLEGIRRAVAARQGLPVLVVCEPDVLVLESVEGPEVPFLAPVGPLALSEDLGPLLGVRVQILLQL